MNPIPVRSGLTDPSWKPGETSDSVYDYLSEQGRRTRLWQSGTGMEETEALRRVHSRLGDAVIDPSLWPEIMEQLCGAIAAKGALLLRADNQTTDVPRTDSLEELVSYYFKNSWHLRDIRGSRAVPLLLDGKRAFIDEDVLTPDDFRHQPLLNECMMPKGFKWAAGVGFSAGTALWGLCLHRGIHDEPFSRREADLLAGLSAKLTEVATLSTAVGRIALTSTTGALDLVGQAAIAIDRFGRVVGHNKAAGGLFGQDIRVGRDRILIRDRQAGAELERFLDRLRVTPDVGEMPLDPIVVRRDDKLPILMRILPIDGAARAPFLGGRALIVLSDLASKPPVKTSEIARIFGLTFAEARLATLLETGLSLYEAAESLGVTRETVRRQLKSVFSKIGVRRQSELIAVLARI